MVAWREHYKSEWKPASKRVIHVRDIIASWSLKLRVEDGFMATSTQQLLPGMPVGHEIGEPDLKILWKKEHIANVEVTGSEKKNILGDDELWLRPDKVQWALQHPIPKTWAWWVYKNKEFVKPTTEIEKYPVEIRKPNGVPEKYHIIPSEDAYGIDMLRSFLIGSNGQI